MLAPQYVPSPSSFYQSTHHLLVVSVERAVDSTHLETEGFHLPWEEEGMFFLILMLARIVEPRNFQEGLVWVVLMVVEDRMAWYHHHWCRGSS